MLSSVVVGDVVVDVFLLCFLLLLAVLLFFFCCLCVAVPVADVADVAGFRCLLCCPL